MTYEERNRLQISKLHPATQIKVRHLLERLVLVGEDVLITQGYRSDEEQDDLYALGRTKLGNKVTWVKGGWSFHQFGAAVDIAPVALLLPLSERGVLSWYSIPRFSNIALQAKEIGFSWGYDMWGIDRPHFQYTQGMTIHDFRAGKELSVGVAREEYKQDMMEQLQKMEMAFESPAVTDRRKKQLTHHIERLSRKIDRVGSVV